MAPVRRNGVLLKSTGPDSGERRVGKRAHSAPGQDATIQWMTCDHQISESVMCNLIKKDLGLKSTAVLKVQQLTPKQMEKSVTRLKKRIN